MSSWLQVQRDELVLFVTDESHTREAEAAEAWARAHNALMISVFLNKDEIQSGKAIEKIAVRLERADVIVGATDYSFITAPEVQEACRQGARFLSLPLSCSDGSSLLENDFIMMDPLWALRKGRRLAFKLNRASEIRVTTISGTDLLFSKKGRRAGVYCGLATKRHTISSTSFEVYVPIVENATEGTLVLDGSLGYIGTVSAPVRCSFHEGVLQLEESGYDADRLNTYINSFGDSRMWRNGEFGIGLNTVSRCRGVSYIEDESAYGTFHIGMGRNISLGGTQNAAGHFDIVTHAPTIYADGRCIMKDGIII